MFAFSDTYTRSGILMVLNRRDKHTDVVVDVILQFQPKGAVTTKK